MSNTPEPVTWEADYTPADPAAWGSMPPLTEETASLRIQGEHRLWTIMPRQGSCEQDHWTVVGSPRPEQNSEAGCIENGQFPTLQIAMRALLSAEAQDTGENDEEDETPIPDLSAVPEGTLIFQRTASTERHDMGRVIPAITEYRRLWAFAPYLDSHKEA